MEARSDSASLSGEMVTIAKGTRIARPLVFDSG